MKKKLSKIFSSLIILMLILPAFPVQVAQAVSPDIVISQVYGGGGNSGAPYTHDFVELFNRGTTSVSLAGWSIQYASATGTGNFGGTSAQITELPNVSLAPGQYYLVQQAAGAGNGVSLPTPDLVDPTPIAMAAGAGKVALVTQATTLGCNGGSAPCDASQLALIKDLVGYGNANFFEGSAAPTLSNTTSASRAANGCQDTDNNASDFTSGAPAPRNSSSPLNPCSAEDAAPEVSDTFPADGATDFPIDANLTVTFSEPVDVTDPWYELSCSVSGTVSADYSGGPTTFTIDPDISLDSGESCTLTVLAGQVSDQDSNDPPDNMEVNFVVGFSPLDVCVATYTPIYDIQGSGSSAAITGIVTTQGVVVGDFEGPISVGLQGFYMQDATGDGDATTSDGIFVFTGNTDNGLSAGDLVRVTGFARERFNQTALNGSNSNSAPVTDIVNCGTGSVAPVDVTMPFPDATYLERFEGMLVRFPQALVISEFFNYDRFGEMVLTLDRQFQPTAVFEPGSPERADLAASNALNRITLDDGLGSQNPDFTRHPNGDAFSLDNRFRNGDTVANAVGVLGFDFSLYRIQPTGPADYTAVNLRPESPDDVGGNLTVASFNVLNYFTTIDTGAFICGPDGDQECRGADNMNEFTRQRDKILAALAAMDADVVGLIEIENHPADVPTADLVSGLNDAMGAGTYAYIATGAIGTDAIRQAFIYKPATVSPLGDFAILDTSVDPRFLDDFNRPVLAQTFVNNSTGGVFTVAVNHLKSKGSACNAIGDPDTGDGAGNCNLTRLAAAEALVDWLATDPTGSGDEDFLIIGDLNSYDKEDPIDAILAGADDALGTADDYTDLLFNFIGEFAYSYLFDGQLGYLDHALANSDLLDEVTGVTVWHINADEADLIDYDTTFKSNPQDAIYAPDAYRSSDHDPVIVGLVLTTEAEIFELIDDVQELIDDGTLNHGQGNALISKLENVLAKLAAGHTNAAAHQLDAFIHQVEDYVDEGILTPEQGNQLIQAAALLVAALSG
jgi:uncharacterized protein